jgi:two-component system response regulator NreC
MERTRILLADDHSLLRDALRPYLQSQPDLDVVAEAGSAEEALRRTAETAPDVVLLDVVMPGGGGIGAVPELRRQNPGARVLILSEHAEPSYLRAALAAGASGYVLKASPASVLLEAIRAVRAGDTYVDEPMRPHLADPPPNNRAHNTAPITRLSERERQVLVWLAQGLRYQAIAERMGVSVKTVETYRSRLTAKLGFKNRADLRRFAIESGILANAPLEHVALNGAAAEAPPVM